MHVLIINPWIYDFAAYDYWLKPLGLLSIAALLREKGISLSFIDCLDRHHPLMIARHKGKAPRENNQHGHGQFFKERIRKPAQLASVPRCYSRYDIHPDVLLYGLQQVSPPPAAILMTTLMTYWYPGTKDTLDMVRQVFPRTPVIIGGNYVTLCPEHALHLGADHYVHGYGEDAICSILHEITGIDIKSGPEDGDNLDRLPYPAFDLSRDLDYICIQTSRGCPFRCSYCASGLLQQGFTRFSPGRVLDEIQYWVRSHGIQNIVFYDDALLFHQEEHIIPILTGILARGLHNTISLHTPNGLHARFITPGLAQLMFQTGFRTIRLGYETANPLRQKETGGKVKDEELEAALSYLREAGFPASALGVYILMGLPGQKAGEIEDSVERVLRMGGTPVLAEFSPIPGTEIWEECLRHSRFDLANDPLFHNNSIVPCAWEGFSWEDYLRIKTMVGAIRTRLMAKDAPVHI